MSLCVFLRCFAGFLLQIGTGAAFALLPFREESFRYPLKRIVRDCCVIVLLLCFGFPIVRMFAMRFLWKYVSLVENLYMMAGIAICSVFYFRCVQEETVRKLVALVLTIFYESTQYLLVNLFFSLLLKETQVLTEPYPPLILGLEAVTALVLFPLEALLMRKVVLHYLEEIEIGYIKREFNAVFAVTVLYIALLVYYDSTTHIDLLSLWWWVAPPLIFISGLLYTFYWVLFREAISHKRSSEYQKTIEIQQLQYKNITSEMEYVRRLRHDMKYYLRALSDMIEQGKSSEMKAYLDEVLGRVSERENRNYCQNSVVNGILQYYMGMAKDENIRCQVQAECGRMDISPMDLTVLLGNALENSIRACREADQNRWILIQIGMISGSLAIQISNTCKEIRLKDPEQKKKWSDGRYLPAAAFQSRKESGGYGLGSIEYTARKYGGEARFCYDEKEKMFTAQIRLNLAAE